MEPVQTVMKMIHGKLVAVKIYKPQESPEPVITVKGGFGQRGDK